MSCSAQESEPSGWTPTARSCITPSAIPALVAAADLPVVHEVLGGIRPRLSWLMRLYSDPVPIHAEHLELVDAIRAGDVDRATRVLAEHLETGKRTALGYVRER